MVRPFIFKPVRKSQPTIVCLSNLKTFFNFYIKCERFGKSPIQHIVKTKIDIRIPEILKVEQARRLIEMASAHRDGIILAYFSIALFCGIRPAEIHGGLMRTKASKQGDSTHNLGRYGIGFGKSCHQAYSDKRAKTPNCTDPSKLRRSSSLRKTASDFSQEKWTNKVQGSNCKSRLDRLDQ